jgi:hypothetical protein
MSADANAVHTAASKGQKKLLYTLEMAPEPGDQSNSGSSYSSCCKQQQQ